MTLAERTSDGIAIIEIDFETRDDDQLALSRELIFSAV